MDDGGPAFPVELGSQHDQYFGSKGMSLRDWFAAHCPDEEVPKLTVGDVRKRFGFTDDFGSPEQWRLLRCEARYAFADAMMEARKK